MSTVIDPAVVEVALALPGTNRTGLPEDRAIDERERVAGEI
jgi:hypothetical protein